MFGIAGGGEGMGVAHRFFPHRAGRILGFDSFSGLPEESEASRIASSGVWRTGDFRPPSRLPRKIRGNATRYADRLIQSAGGPDRAAIFPGFFNISLTERLVKRELLRPALYVDIDCDLHVSALQALDWLFANSLVGIGTMIGYDGA